MNSHPNRRRRIWATDPGTVCLRDEGEMGREIIREFWAPPAGGVVREIDAKHPGTLGTDVCGMLSHRGVTLVASPETLLDAIRAEYRRAVADDKRQWRADRVS